jgi:hypothetical protein
LWWNLEWVLEIERIGSMYSTVGTNRLWLVYGANHRLAADGYKSVALFSLWVKNALAVTCKTPMSQLRTTSINREKLRKLWVIGS